MTGWEKAGLIGAVLVVVLSVLGLIAAPLGRGVGYCVVPAAESVVYGFVGALAVYWMSPVRTKGAAAVRGASAGVTAAVIGGVGNIAVNVGAIVVLGPVRAAALRSLLLPDLLVGTGDRAVATFVAGAAYFGLWLLIAAALGALGGLIFVAVRPHKETA